jgi:vancomycin permeability regulator SanA
MIVLFAFFKTNDSCMARQKIFARNEIVAHICTTNENNHK